jgi:adenylate cyclase
MNTRRLAAILAADVVGFSSMMEKDEEGTLVRIKALQRKTIESYVAQHHGRMVKTTGDGFLIEFPSPVEAVRCAISIQEKAATGPLQLRIGINLGDIIIEEDGDVYGEGVNVAARLEALCDAGGLLISGKVFDEIEGKIDRTFESRGEYTVKNITKPVRVYALEVNRPISSGTERTKLLPVPDKPSIAVLPFTNMSGDPEQEYFADGMTEDIITGLSRLKWLFVIARNSTFTFKGKAVDVRQVGQDLGVRYVLEGVVRVSGSRIRITGQLIDAASGRHIWAERYDRQLDDVFAVQDEITASVVAAIEPHLYAEEGARVASQSPENISAWGLVVRSIGLIGKLGRKENEEARSLLERAIAIEPTYAKAPAILSWAVWWAYYNYWLPDGEEGIALAQSHAEHALALDPSEPWARMMSGLCVSAEGQHERALPELEAALRVNPSFALAHTIYGWALARAGRFEDAVVETQTALRLSPADTFLSFYEFFHGFTLLVSGRFEDALPYLHRGVVAFPNVPTHFAPLISCYGHLGSFEQTEALLVHRNSFAAPPLTVSLVRNMLRKYPYGSIIAEGLIKAGVPES